MIFNTWTFGLFAVITLPAYWLIPSRNIRIWSLLFAGIVFYAASVPGYVLLILGLAVGTLLIGKTLVGQPSLSYRRSLLAVGVCASVGTLVVFKYTNFFLGSVSALCGSHCTLPVWTLTVPLALSFFTFEFVHFLVDVYLGKIERVNTREFMSFAMFFPTLVAGPIKRYQNYVPQLARIGRPGRLMCAAGVFRILMGLAKKMIIADSMTPLTQPLLSPSGLYDHADFWVAMLAYTVKIYFDFTAYSDIAIGLASLLGLQILENFDRPYWSRNISEFWRRWHISLSSWIRDYVFIPIGGSRGPKWRVAFNLALVMAVAGLWHGAAWHFVAWGLWHGVGLGAHRVWSLTKAPSLVGNTRLAHAVSIAMTFGFVALGWVLFASPTLQAAGAVFAGMFGGHAG
ncbi:MAG: MBOAT family O-acyltransferase [Candidatus Tyrphobacter sp.]